MEASADNNEGEEGPISDEGQLPASAESAENETLPARLPPLTNTTATTTATATRLLPSLNNRVAPLQQQSSKPPSSLLQMLECPVCLEIAFKPPIFQCPEGHLLCQDCNSRLRDCPQCGHALMNSRNRTAEELAAKMEDSNGVHSSKAVAISVSEPKKVRKGLFAHVVYTVRGRINRSILPISQRLIRKLNNPTGARASTR